jgi:hypothetical protein
MTPSFEESFLPHIVNVELAFSQKRPEAEGCFLYLNIAIKETENEFL